MQRDPLFFSLYHALDPEYCAICDLSLRGVQRFLDSYLYERVNNPWSREEFITARGFCAEHGWQLRRSLDSATGVTFLYEHLLRDFAQLFDSRADQHLVETGARQWFPRAARPGAGTVQILRGWLAPGATCPACRDQWETEDRYVSTFSELIFDSDLRASYESSLGLCLPHLTITMDQITRSDDFDWLVRTERQFMNNLLRDLKEFWRKHDYRFRTEPVSRAEATSWTRALYKVGGGPGMVWRRR